MFLNIISKKDENWDTWDKIYEDEWNEESSETVWSDKIFLNFMCPYLYKLEALCTPGTEVTNFTETFEKS